jgi:hypothetical protein
MYRLQERRSPDCPPGIFLRPPYHFRHVRFWICNASQRCSLGRSSRWVGPFRTHLLWAIIDFDSLCIYPPSHQFAYPRTQHERTRFDACRSFVSTLVTYSTYDIVKFDELRDYDLPDHFCWFHETANCCRNFHKRQLTFSFGASEVSGKFQGAIEVNAHRFSKSRQKSYGACTDVFLDG